VVLLAGKFVISTKTPPLTPPKEGNCFVCFINFVVLLARKSCIKYRNKNNKLNPTTKYKTISLPWRGQGRSWFYWLGNLL